MYAFVLPMSDLTVSDNWVGASAMRGTGSNAVFGTGRPRPTGTGGVAGPAPTDRPPAVPGVATGGPVAAVSPPW